MANHTDLPISKVAYDLLVVATDLTKNMPRDFKASIGKEIRDECVRLTVLIFRANCRGRQNTVPRQAARARAGDRAAVPAFQGHALYLRRAVCAGHRTDQHDRQAGRRLEQIHRIVACIFPVKAGLTVRIF